MSNLLVVDVFESYYEGRKAPFPAGVVGTLAQGKPDDRKPQGKGGKPEQPVQQAA